MSNLKKKLRKPFYLQGYQKLNSTEEKQDLDTENHRTLLT